MEMSYPDKTARWLLPVLLILFILVILTLPATVNVSYADRSEAPLYQLSYTIGKLLWDPGTPVDSRGVAIMDLFHADYDNVLSADGTPVVAPGTDGHNIIRLRNHIRGEVTYTAVLFRIRSDESLKVEPRLDAHNCAPVANYPLPGGVERSQVVQAVTGKLEGGRIVDLDLSWNWLFEEGEEQDLIDTALGSKVEPDSVSVGLYIVIEDGNSLYFPRTGDDGNIGVYAVLLAMSLVILALLVFEWRRREDEDEPGEAECQC